MDDNAQTLIIIIIIIVVLFIIIIRRIRIIIIRRRMANYNIELYTLSTVRLMFPKIRSKQI